jgi:hypothetical protein
MEQFKKHPLYKRHNIDSAMSSLWEFYKKYFIALFLISLAMSVVIQYASSFINIKELQTVTDPMVMLEMMKGYIVPILIVSVVNLLFTTILQYYILYSPLNIDDSFFMLLVKSLRYFIPYLITITLLVFAGSIAIVLGIFVVIIGAFFAALYVMTLYLFILPVMMVEDANIGNTISRTFSLAHKNFWSNIGWVAVFLVILIVISVIFSGIILLPFTGSFVKTLMNPEDASNLIDVTKNPLFIAISAIVSALTMPLMPIFSCILYFNGKAEEEQDHSFIKAESVNEKVRVEDLYAKPYSDDHPDNPDNPEKNV